MYTFLSLPNELEIIHIQISVPIALYILIHQDAATKILEILDVKPDLVIGNYTDGNLVASLMASKLGVTQVGFIY